MKSQWGKGEFENFLAWLDPDRDRAAVKHEEARRRLIKFFECRGCPVAEELADESIDRVIIKIKELASVYVGERMPYFYGVARKVYLESLHRPPVSIPPVPDDPPDETSPEYTRLRECLERLPQKDRDLIVEYYEEDKQAKIDHRKALADRLGITGSTLRLRAHRIRALLQDCVVSALALKIGHP